MDPPPPFKFPSSPGTPLFPLSPERVNGTRPPYGANPPQSPSMPEFVKPSEFTLNPSSPTRLSHSRNNSEALVHGMVARFDSLSLKDHQQIHRRDEVAIKRAEMAREMAELELAKVKTEREERESDVRKLREEARRLKREVEEGKDRERKMLKRLEAQADDVERSIKTYEHQKALMEKENRRLRKEAFKSESLLVKTQEELKATRNSLRIAQSGLESEKAKSFRREQDAFTAEYKLVGVQEELTRANERVKVVEEERDALKTSLKEEEVARIAAEGHIALPTSQDDEDDEFDSPKKSPRKNHIDTEDKENVMPKRSVEVKALQEELDTQRRLRQRAEDQIEYMKMECQFLCCSCRVAEQCGSQYVHDNSFSEDMERIRGLVATKPMPYLSDEAMETCPAPESATKISVVPEADDEIANEQPLTAVEYSPTSGTFRSVIRSDELAQSSTERTQLDVIEEVMSDAPQLPPPEEEAADTTVLRNQCETEQMAVSSSDLPSSPMKEATSETTQNSPPQTPHAPHTPKFREVRTVTTTTTIPLTFTPSSTPAPAYQTFAPQTPATIGHPPILKAPMSPFPFSQSPGAALRPDGTLDREAALEQIRLRRGRARSVAMGLSTPKKQMIEGIARRDISAPALKGRC
ncbi:hypothetical protein NA57DRAFT_70664 [Rhizodiscina lignyota]|uniref:Uncharacterized protein n=1 Tax=Rhizodiscina lignyota TaxID=1504668 RepID=A0A9P4IS96_9PEZI|nr:hypothetical protein NA57DRAFT_70664 [Rhizodiscina lignyota]